jgi:hypothetical protein
MTEAHVATVYKALMLSINLYAPVQSSFALPGAIIMTEAHVATVYKAFTLNVEHQSLSPLATP